MERGSIPSGQEDCREAAEDSIVIECQNHTIQEVAKIFETGGTITIASERSRDRMARWLRELAVSRDAVYSAQVALADIERAHGKGEF